ncbi:MAG: hypothetical protein EOP09_10555, partial [Proteobacteria bacterium]
MTPELQNFFQQIQKSCLPGIWSKGVALARAGSVHLDSETSKEIVLRVSSDSRAVSHKVSLWVEDEDTYCDCDERAEPCSHVAAAVSALRLGLKVKPPSETQTSNSHVVQYRLFKKSSALHLERLINGAPLTESLMSAVSGRESGRIALPKIIATQDDFAMDAVWGEAKQTQLDRARLDVLRPRLKNLTSLMLDEELITIGHAVPEFQLVIRDEKNGFRLIAIPNPQIKTHFEGHLAQIGSQIVSVTAPSLTPEELKLVQGEGSFYQGPHSVVRLVSEILPRLREKTDVEIQTRNLPSVTHDLPELVLKTESLDAGMMSIVAMMEYPSAYSARNPREEQELTRKLRDDLNLVPGLPVVVQGREAAQFLSRAKQWRIKGEAQEKVLSSSALAQPITQTQTLVAIGRVWGFLKYYHPQVARGKIDWDGQLIQL